ncbi:MAG: DNA polymerase I [Lachnospiraceae bacterium]|nr:DNA polymerase I [Lachnospiraceae bacterium]
MNKILLIDGHSILHRAFYGVPDLTNKDGLHTNAIYGFLNILFKTMDDEKPTHLAVAFDLHAPTFRHEMYKEYKGTRSPMPDELREQIPVMKNLLQAMNIPIMEFAGLEADDILGTMAKKAQANGMEAVIMSGDRDLLQIADEHIKIRIPKTKGGKTEVEEYFPKDVEEKYGVTPKQFIDVKALMGDSSDNIPGVPKVGEKTAAGLIGEYKSLDGIYENIENITKPAIRTSLAENKELAYFCKKLVTIVTDADLPFSIDEMVIGNFYNESSFAKMKELELKSYLSRFDVSSVKPVAEVKVEILSDVGELISALSENQTIKETALSVKFLFGELNDYDHEKTVSEGQMSLFDASAGKDPVTLRRILAAAVGTGEKTYALSVDSSSEEAKLTELFRKHFSDVSGNGDGAPGFITDGVKPYYHFLPESVKDKPAKEISGCFFDVLIAAYLLNPLKSDYDCESVIEQYANPDFKPYITLFNKAKPEELLAGHTKEEYLKYLGCVAAGNYAAYRALEEKLENTGEIGIFKEIEMPVSLTLFEMEQEGIRILPDELKKYSESLDGRIAELKHSIHEKAGEEFNINSPKQLGEILFEKMQIEGGKKTKTGYSTAAEVLEKLAPDYPIVSEILEYRALTKLKSTYAEALADQIAKDGRIHTTFQQTVTATGRLSSTDPNLQNIPIRTELGRLLRKVFVPKSGWLFMDADYSQIELRILAHLSEDSQLIEAYNSGEDIHAITASKVFHVPLNEVTPLLRRRAKAVNFGIVYGISSFGLSQDLGLSRKEAQGYIEEYFATYPGIKGFLDKAVEDAKQKGYSETMYHRRRPIPELKSSNFMQRSFGERVAMNAPIQGTAADIMKIAMIRVRDALKLKNLQSRILIQVHDELLLEVKESESAEVAEILSGEMEHAALLAVKLEADLHTGANWYDAK